MSGYTSKFLKEDWMYIFFLRKETILMTFTPALVAQLDALPTGDQEVACWVGNIL